MAACTFRLCFHNTYFTHRSIVQRSLSNVKYVAELQSDIEEQITSRAVKPKHQPGRRRLACLTFPEQLVKSVEKIGNDLCPDLFKDAKQLNNQLFSRRPAIEREEYVTRAELLIAKKFKGKPEELTQEHIDAICLNVKNKLKQETGRWKPIVYDEHTSKANLIARLAPNFAVISWVFSEITKSVPSFVPKTFLDFGSGVGSAVWAAHNTWGKELEEYFCVDISPDMNSLAERLLKEDDEEETFLKTLYFRQFLPTSNKINYDLVVSAFSMMELPSLKERLRIIDILWQKTKDTLVVIENGSFAGYSMVMDARDYILHIENAKRRRKGEAPRNGAYVVAPCPHDKCCPNLQGEKKLVPCNFSVHYKPLFPSQGAGTKKEVFSFVVLRKKHRQMDTEPWPRVMKTSKRKGHVQCHLCCSDGKLHNVILSKGKNTRAAYRCARVSTTGDLLPVSLSAVLKESKESEEELQNNSESNETNLTL